MLKREDLRLEGDCQDEDFEGLRCGESRSLEDEM